MCIRGDLRKLRCWKDRSGSIVFEGWLDDVVDDRAILAREGGIRKTIALNDLSQLDRTLITEALRIRASQFFACMGVKILGGEAEDITVIDDEIIIISRRIPIGVVNTPTEAEQLLSQYLVGKAICFHGQVGGVYPIKEAAQVRVDFCISAYDTHIGTLDFRDQLFLPAGLLDTAAIRAAEGEAPVIMLQGRLAVEVKPRPKHANADTQVDCPYCFYGWMSTTGVGGHRRYGKVVCYRCKGARRLSCDPYETPIGWNPFDVTDPHHAIIGQLLFYDEREARVMLIGLHDMTVTIPPFRLSRSGTAHSVKVECL